MKKSILVIDGNNIMHRAYHGMPLLRTEDGRYTNAVFGFLKMLKKAEEELSPDYEVICFDKGKNTFRHRLFEGYKAQRKPMDPELSEQFPLIRQVLEANGYTWLEHEEYEADDLMATVASKAAQQGMEAVIFSGDKDLLQMLDDNIRVLSGRKKLDDLKLVTAEDFRAQYGLEPKALIDLKGLMGDSSDNYPGVKGVGEKTGLKLLQQYGSLEGIYANEDNLPENKLKEKILAEKESAFLSKKLATIVTDVPFEREITDFTVGTKDYEVLSQLYSNLEFRSFLKEIEDERESNGGEPDLFAMAGAEKPFEITYCHNISGLHTDNGVSLLSAADTLYLADGDYNVYKTDININIDNNEIPDFSGLKAILEDSSIKKYISGFKELCRFCLKREIDLDYDSVVDACELMAYLLDADGSYYDAVSLVKKYLDIDLYIFEEEKLAAACCSLFELCKTLRTRLDKYELTRLYECVELPLTPVLADMEHTGIRVDKKVLSEMSSELGEEITLLEQSIYKLAGEEFNLNSPKQMSVILFEKLKLPAGKKTKSGYSTGSEILEGLAPSYPICSEILRYRMLSKLKSTYTDALDKYISPRDGKIHTAFLQTVTSTGRLSSADPNLQNIPVREQEGRRIRKAFAAGDDEHILVAADYSQIELRLLAHFAGDPVLMEAFRNNEDIHARTAADISGIPMSEVTRDMRRAAKTVNFGIIYGMSSYSLGNDLHISRREAEEYMEAYFKRYPRVKEYQNAAVEEATANGYALTMMGRRRYLPDLKNRNFNLRSFAQRNAMNMPLQGTAADIIKIVMVALFAKLKDKGLKSKIILQVHDELILDCLKSEEEAVIKLLHDVMEHTVSLSVPLPVEVKTGENWLDMNKI